MNGTIERMAEAIVKADAEIEALKAERDEWKRKAEISIKAMMEICDSVRVVLAHFLRLHQYPSEDYMLDAAIAALKEVEG